MYEACLGPLQDELTSALPIRILQTQLHPVQMVLTPPTLKAASSKMTPTAEVHSKGRGEDLQLPGSTPQVNQQSCHLDDLFPQVWIWVCLPLNMNS